MTREYLREFTDLMVDNDLSIINRIRRGTNYYLEIYYKGSIYKMIIDIGIVRLGEFQIKSNTLDYPEIEDVSGIINLFKRDLNFKKYGI